MLSIVLGLIIIVILALQNKLIRIRHQLHLIRYNGLYWPATTIRKEGLVAATRRHKLTPTGFYAPCEWTTTPPCRGGKHLAVPENVLDVLMPRDARGRRIGSSLFISDDRGGFRKQRYLQALLPDRIDVKSTVEKAIAQTPMTGSAVSWALYVCSDITWSLHSGRTDKAATKDIVRMCHALTRTLNDPFGRTFFASRAKARLRRRADAAEDGFFKHWRDAGMTRTDAFVEFVHNIFGMTLQWTFVLLRIMTSRERPTTLVRAMQFIVDDPPAIVAASRKECPARLQLHDLKVACKGARVKEEHLTKSGVPQAEWRTRVTPTQAIVPLAFSLSEQEDYVPFGCGHRRCPGEWATYEFVLACASTIPLQEIAPSSKSRWRMVGLRRVLDFQQRVQRGARESSTTEVSS